MNRFIFLISLFCVRATVESLIFLRKDSGCFSIPRASSSRGVHMNVMNGAKVVHKHQNYQLYDNGASDQSFKMASSEDYVSLNFVE